MEFLNSLKHFMLTPIGSKNITEISSLTLKLSIIAFSSLILMYISHYLIDPISRRQVNLAFIFWIIFTCSFNIIIELVYFVFIQIVQPRIDYESKILKIWSRKGLIIFLIANLLTGAINFFFNTLQIANNLAFIILISYISCLTLIGFLLNKK